jgi:hypothetical protein
MGVGKGHRSYKRVLGAAEIEERSLDSAPTKGVGTPLGMTVVRHPGIFPRLRKLAQKAHIVLKKRLNVVDAVLEHG